MAGPSRMYLVRGVAAAKAGDITEARLYLEKLLALGPTPDEEEKAKLWLARIETDPAKKRDWFETLAVEFPFNPEIQRELALLKGELKPDELINPDSLESVAATAPRCPRCGSELGVEEGATERRCPLCGWYAALVPEAIPAADAETLLRQGMAAARGGDKERARQAFTRILQAKPDTVPQETVIQAWLWLSGLTTSVEERRRCLEAVLRLNPDHAIAKQGLALLDAQTPPQPTATPDEAPADPVAMLKARRITCPKCGGSMTARGNNLECDYCGYKRPILYALHESSVAGEQNFTVALATAKGHRLPIGMGVLKCQACGAQYLLLATQMSVKCAYCGSPHVVEAGQMSLISPHGVVPMKVTAGQAELALRAWLEEKKLQDAVYIVSLQGAFVPVWTFDVGGEVAWQATVVVNERGRNNSMVRYDVSGAYPLMEDDVRVPASHTLPMKLSGVVDTFDTNQAKPFMPEFVASWPVEIYSVTVSDASIVARSKALSNKQSAIDFQIRMQTQGGSVHNLRVNTARVAIQSYKLVLIPLWVARYKPVTGVEEDAKPGYIVIQGQTGTVYEPPRHSLMGDQLGTALDELLDDVSDFLGGLFGRRKKS